MQSTKAMNTRTVRAGLTSLDVAIAALLIAAGAVIRLVVPPMFDITPNFAIAMYSLSILLIRPRLPEAIGIGVVAGLVCMITSKAAYPVNLLSEPVGAVVCLGVMSAIGSKAKGFVLTPLISTALATLASGLTFLSVYYIFHLAPVAVIVGKMMVTVITLTILNAVIAQALYFPAKKMLNR